MTRMQQYNGQYKYRQIVKAKLYMDSHFGENIDLVKIADQSHFSKFHFIRLFKNIYEVTPNQYLTAVRVKNAKALLSLENSVSEVCYLVGFDSVSSFKGLFRRETHFTPSNYKKHILDLQFSMKNSPTIHMPKCFTKIAWLQKSNIQDT